MEKRRFPRVGVGGRPKGRVAAIREATLLNISIGGALIGHEDLVRPGSTCFFELELHGKWVKLRSRVVRSESVRQEETADGEMALIYHSGLEFLDLQETKQLVDDYIESITNDGNAMLADKRHRSYSCQKCGTSFELLDSEIHPVFTEPRKRPVQAGDLFYYAHDTCEGVLACTFGGRRVRWVSEEEE